MKTIGLRCVNCGREYGLGLVYECAQCHFPLEVQYVAPSAGEQIEDAEKQGIWRYASCLPALSEEKEISLGEGNTPLIHIRRLGERMGVPELFVKNEGQNPTGSFKDRPTAIGVSMALSFGLDTVAVSSTGNAGASLAAYAARAGLRSRSSSPTGRRPQNLPK
jgi:threonine synthase